MVASGGVSLYLSCRDRGHVSKGLILRPGEKLELYSAMSSKSKRYSGVFLDSDIAIIP